MNMPLSEYRWVMPSAQAFFTNLASRTAEGINTVVLLNHLADSTGLGNQLVESIQKAGRVQPVTVNVSSRPGAAPLMEMGRILRIHGDYSLGKLISTGETPQAFIVYGLLPNSENAKEWVQLAYNWAQQMTVISPMNTLVVLYPNAVQNLPPPCERFQYVRWEEHSSALELSLCCRLYGQANQVHPILQRWIETMLSSLALGDLLFAEKLWSTAVYANGVMSAVMKDYARQRGWQEGDAAGVLSQFSRVMKERSTAQVSQWWWRGWLIHSAEYGLEPHSALLSLHPQGEEILIRRVWRAQAALVLPAIDSMRSRLIAKAKRYFPNVSGLSGITELGELETFLKNENTSRPQVSRLLNDTTFTRLLRNDLAHYQPITFERYRQLLERDRE